MADTESRLGGPIAKIKRPSFKHIRRNCGLAIEVP
jgi:hypothetical protein